MLSTRILLPLKQTQTKQLKRTLPLLGRLLAPDAKERIARMSLVKPEKARKLGDMVIQMGRGGRMQEPLSDTQLKNMLEKISEGACFLLSLFCLSSVSLLCLSSASGAQTWMTAARSVHARPKPVLPA